mgnify:FL=1
MSKQTTPPDHHHPPPPAVASAPPLPESPQTKRGRPKGSKNGVKPKELALSKEYDLQWFPERWLGEKPYGWQFDVLEALNLKESRVALKAANGSGKTSMVAASAVLWHVVNFPESLCVCTAGVFRQVEAALWPSIKRGVQKMTGGDGFEVTQSGLRFCNGSRAIGFSASDAHKAEGWHRQGPSNNLMFIIDEAKGCEDGIFHAMERCQPSRILIMSSPGSASGYFYEAFTKQRERWATFSVSAFDCPHLTKEWIDEQISAYGEKSPLIRSMIYGEFMDDSDEGVVLGLKELEECLGDPPERKEGMRVAFCDFAAGGDETVFCLREGNEITQMEMWKERDTNKTVGRLIGLFDKYGLVADEIYGDEGGLGLPLCDALMEGGYDIHRVNFGGKPFDARYQNRGAEMWHTGARAISNKDVRLPDDTKLHQQLVTRRAEVNRQGKLGLEPKDRMKSRGLASPDRADAVLGAIACGGGIGGSWERYDAISRPTVNELYEEASLLADDIGAPSGANAGC